MDDFGFLKTMALHGETWVLYALFACSILSGGIIIDRLWVLRRERHALEVLEAGIMKLIDFADWNGAAKLAKSVGGGPSSMPMSALRSTKDGIASMEERVAFTRGRVRKSLEKRLLILGTLGNNSPFIGLFGTVLGVIKAFDDMQGSTEGASAAMKGLSEALIATAVGLIVAIPAVMFFNGLSKQVDDTMTDSDGLIHVLYARIKSSHPGGPAESAEKSEKG